MDVISNMLITIKNGGSAKKDVVTVPYSQFKHSILEALRNEGYIEGYEKKTRKKGSNILEVKLSYDAKGNPKIVNLKRISRPSRRLYAGVHDLYRVKEGHGRLFLSTPKGILTGKNAQKEQVGGELLFEIW